MTSRYFGILKDTDYENIDSDELDSLYLKLAIKEKVSFVELSFPLEPSIVLKCQKIKPLEKRIQAPIREKVIFNNDLKKELYSYLLSIFEKSIQIEDVKYSETTYRSFIGITSEKKIKRKKLRHFNKILDSLIGDVIIQTKEKKGVDELFEKQSCFVYLNNRRDTLMNQIIQDDDLVTNYLLGNSEFFQSDVIYQYHIIQSFIDFESKLRILVLENDKFHFQENQFFTKIAKLDFAYVQFREKPFSSLDGLYFINYYFGLKKDVPKMQIWVLYAALVELKLILKDKRSFIDFINNYYSQKYIIKEIRNISTIPNDKTESDLQEMIKKIESFSSRN